MFAGWSEFKLTGSLSCVGIVGGGVLVGSSCSIDTIVHSEVTFHGQCLLPRGALASTHDRKTKTWATHQHFEICIGHRGCWYLYLWIRLGINWINSIRMLTFRVSYRLILDTPTLRKKQLFLGGHKAWKNYSYLLTPWLFGVHLSLESWQDHSSMMCYNPACGGVPPTFYETYVRQIQELPGHQNWLWISMNHEYLYSLKRRVENSLMFWTFRIMKSSWCVDRVLRRRQFEFLTTLILGHFLPSLFVAEMSSFVLIFQSCGQLTTFTCVWLVGHHHWKCSQRVPCDLDSWSCRSLRCGWYSLI